MKKLLATAAVLLMMAAPGHAAHQAAERRRVPVAPGRGDGQAEDHDPQRWNLANPASWTGYEHNGIVLSQSLWAYKR